MIGCSTTTSLKHRERCMYARTKVPLFLVFGPGPTKYWDSHAFDPRGNLGLLLDDIYVGSFLCQSASLPQARSGHCCIAY